jgi:NAD(P)-dependent dehydrogenase (short-subunit alcohol dehydrogenase family)
MPRILVTGTSSGFGRAIATQPVEQGQEVIATMRAPCAAGLPVSNNLCLLSLGVTDADSTAAAIAQAGPLDASADAESALTSEWSHLVHVSRIHLT